MTLYKVSDLYPDYKDRFFDGDDITNIDVYTGREGRDKVGNIDDLLVDDTGHFRYFIVDTGFWIFGKKVLLPIGCCRVDVQQRRVYTNLTQNQVKQLPEYSHTAEVSSQYEERVRTLYRQPSVENSIPIEQTAAVEETGYIGTTAAQVPPFVSGAPVAEPVREVPPVQPAPPVPSTPPVQPIEHHRTYAEPYAYDREPQLYGMSEANHQQFKLYEERLVAEKHRQKTGEVKISKRVETDTQQLSVPVQKEKIIIEVTSDRPTHINAQGVDFQQGDVAHMDLYEETVDIHKQPVAREIVNIRKEVETETVNIEDQVRREELDIQRHNNPASDPQNPL